MSGFGFVFKAADGDEGFLDEGLVVGIHQILPVVVPAIEMEEDSLGLRHDLFWQGRPGRPDICGQDWGSYPLNCGEKLQLLCQVFRVIYFAGIHLFFVTQLIRCMPFRSSIPTPNKSTVKPLRLSP